MSKIKYLIIFLFLYACSYSTFGNYEKYQNEMRAQLKTVKLDFALACPQKNIQGDDVYPAGCYYGWHFNQTQASADALEWCSIYSKDCVLIMENNTWVYSKQNYEASKRENQLNRFITQCEYIGFKRNTEKMGECVLKISQTEQQIIVNNSGGNDNSLANLIVLQESLKLLNPPNRNVRCNFNSMGGFGSVNCY